MTSIAYGFPGNIRLVEPKKDLLAITDLIESSFANTMDPDGVDYLRQLRAMIGNSAKFFHFPINGYDYTYPIFGFVWEQDRRIIGNLTLIPIKFENRWYFLIANVAVLPDHRHQGIGRLLTRKAIHFAQEHSIASLWLHVRQGNNDAIQMYQALDFKEQAIRTTWVYERPAKTLPPAESRVVFHARRWGEWQQQQQLLKKVYPACIRWNLPLFVDKLAPGLWQGFKNFFGSEEISHASFNLHRRYAGTFTYQRSGYFADHLWLACDPDSLCEETFIAALSHYTAQAQTMKPIQVNFPAGLHRNAFLDAGWRDLHTLIWMKLDL